MSEPLCCNSPCTAIAVLKDRDGRIWCGYCAPKIARALDNVVGPRDDPAMVTFTSERETIRTMIADSREVFELVSVERDSRRLKEKILRLEKVLAILNEQIGALS